MTATVNRPSGRENARPIPADLVRPTRYYWPSQKDRTPTHCGHCGVRLLVGDVPTADYPLTDAACWACTRVACELAHDSMRQVRPAPAFGDQRSSRKGWPTLPDGNAVERLVTRLSEQGADDMAGLVHALAVTESTVRDVIHKARKHGHRIVMSGGLYSLERES